MCTLSMYLNEWYNPQILYLSGTEDAVFED